MLLLLLPIIIVVVAVTKAYVERVYAPRRHRSEVTDGGNSNRV
jgi:hypothetical protein